VVEGERVSEEGVAEVAPAGGPEGVHEVSGDFAGGEGFVDEWGGRVGEHGGREGVQTEKRDKVKSY
jgi:hypothetical protein